MFAKENSCLIDAKGKKAKDVPLRKSDRRALRARALEVLRLETKETAVDEVVASTLDAAFLQGNLNARTLLVPSGGKATLYLRSPQGWSYQSQTQCIWIRYHQQQTVEYDAPGLALLALLPPGSVPTVLIPPHASQFLCRGAHLMKAGMRNMMHNPTVGSVVAVTCMGNPQPMAVGILRDTNLQEKGVGVEILSVYGDDIWKQQVPVAAPNTEGAVTSALGGELFDLGNYGNRGFVRGHHVEPLPEYVKEAEEEDEGDYADGEVAAEEGEASAGVDQIDTPSEAPAVTEIDHDEILHESVCRGLASLSLKTDFPMSVAQFYGQHVLKNRPEGTTIQMKQTRWKKFGPYLKDQMDRGLLKVGPDSSGKDPMAMLVSYDPRHDDVKSLVKEEKAKPKETAKKMVLVDLYAVPNHFVKPMRLERDQVKAMNATSDERKGTGLLTIKEIRTILDEYITREELIDGNHPNHIHLDGPLTDALYKKTSETPPMTLSRKDLVERWTFRMEKAYALVELPGSRMIQLGRGKPPMVMIEVSMRQSRKFVTRVRGMETYGIDGATLCREVSHRFACSGAVDEEAEKGRPALKKGHVELTFQGNLVDELEALLLGDETLTLHGGAKDSPYCLPPNAIHVELRRGVRARKKRSADTKTK